MTSSEELIAEKFNAYFANFNIRVEADEVKIGAVREIRAHGWQIRYRVDPDDAGSPSFEFYATHRMTNDRHVRIWADGYVERLDEIREGYGYAPNVAGSKEAAETRVSGPAPRSPTPVVTPLAAAHRAHPHKAVEPHRGPPPPNVPDFASPCGIGHGDRVELVPCGASGMDLLGISERSVPKGERRDCFGKVDAYSSGAHWWICWIALPGAWVEHDAVSPNPFTAPKSVGGVF